MSRSLAMWGLLLLLAVVPLAQGYAINVDLPEVHESKFYYYGYGSNMLTKRIHIQNPTAVKIGAGLLKNYRLDFNTYTERWHGAPATIVPTDGASVYGTVWDIDISNLDDIDNQEGVNEGLYHPITVPVELANRTLVDARAYMLVDQPETALDTLAANTIPAERQPSKTYLQCMVKGAIESDIAPHYVHWLKTVRHNGQIVSGLESLLELKEVQLLS